VKIKLLKILDQVVGRLLVLLLPAPVKKRFDSVKTVLLIRPGGIGDAVLLIPAIQSLQKTYPHCQIDILAEKRNSQIFSLGQGIRRIYRYCIQGTAYLIFPRFFFLVVCACILTEGYSKCNLLL